jgi:hypothetical protein
MKTTLKVHKKTSERYSGGHALAWLKPGNFDWQGKGRLMVR